MKKREVYEGIIQKVAFPNKGLVTVEGEEKSVIVKNGILREGAIHIDHAWDYFSEKDGEIHHLDLCENCYDEIISGFRIAVEKEPAVEMI